MNKKLFAVLLIVVGTFLLGYNWGSFSTPSTNFFSPKMMVFLGALLIIWGIYIVYKG